MQDRIWVCADGRKLLPGQMTDSHLANCIAKIRRSRKGWRADWLTRLEIEQTIRRISGEGES